MFRYRMLTLYNVHIVLFYMNVSLDTAVSYYLVLFLSRFRLDIILLFFPEYTVLCRILWFLFFFAYTPKATRVSRTLYFVHVESRTLPAQKTGTPHDLAQPRTSQHFAELAPAGATPSTRDIVLSSDIQSPSCLRCGPPRSCCHSSLRTPFVAAAYLPRRSLTVVPLGHFEFK